MKPMNKIIYKIINKITRVTFRTISIFALSLIIEYQAVPSQDPLPLSSQDLKIRLGKSKTRLTIVNLWATWCEPCRDEMPDLLRVSSKYPDVDLILITGDSDTDLKDAANFVAKIGVPFPTFRLTESPDHFMKMFLPNWTAVVPTTILFDKAGHKVSSWVGRIKITELEQHLKTLSRNSTPPSTPSLPPH